MIKKSSFIEVFFMLRFFMLLLVFVQQVFASSIHSLPHDPHVELVRSYRAHIQAEGLNKNSFDPFLISLYKENEMLVSKSVNERFPERGEALQALQKLGSSLIEQKQLSNNTMLFMARAFSDLLITGEDYLNNHNMTIDTLLQKIAQEEQENSSYATKGFYLPLASAMGLFSLKSLNLSFALDTPLVAVPTGLNLSYDGLDAEADEITWHDENHYHRFIEDTVALQEFARRVVPLVDTVAQEPLLNKKIHLILFWMVHEEMFHPYNFPQDLEIAEPLKNFYKRFSNFFSDEFKVVRPGVQRIEDDFMAYIREEIYPDADPANFIQLFEGYGNLFET